MGVVVAKASPDLKRREEYEREFENWSARFYKETGEEDPIQYNAFASRFHNRHGPVFPPGYWRER